MIVSRRHRRHRPLTVVAGLSCITIAIVACLSPAQAQVRPEDAAAFKEFSARVQAFVKVHQTAESAIPALKATDLPEIIAAHQQALARKIQEARTTAKVGDIFTPAACDAFRRISQAALGGPSAANSRAYMEQEAPDPAMPLAVNGLYSGTEPIAALSPALLAGFPPLPAEVAYRVVGRSLALVDLKSHLIVDFARLIIPPA